MAIEKHKLHNESAFKKRIAHLLYPVVFSLFSVLNANGQEIKDTTNIPDQKIIPPTGEENKKPVSDPKTTTLPTEISKDKKTSEKAVDPINAITDSTFLKVIEDIFNKLTKSDLSDLGREKFQGSIIGRLSFYFDDSDDPLKNTPKEDMYVTRNGTTHPLPRFLSTFYKESYRGAGTLSVKVISIYEKDKKIYIEYDYVYTPKDQLKPKQ